nr:uncharacterized protein LOC101236916 [Hydra vulgaris]
MPLATVEACLYSSASLLSNSSLKTVNVLRLLTSIELFEKVCYYASVLVACVSFECSDQFKLINSESTSEIIIMEALINCRANKSFKFEWLSQFSWLAYSSKEDGAYCLPCTLLGASIPNKSGILNLVFKPHQEWGNAVCDYRKHEESCVLHEKPMLLFSRFMKIKPMLLFSRFHVATPQIMLLRNDLAFRDASKYHPDIGESSSQKVGISNFIELLNFCVDAGDQVLANHLSSSPKNATYISKTTQNQLIDSCGKAIEKSLNVLNALQEFGLDIKNCRGQGYGGAGCMAGKYEGVASRIKALNHKAIFVHCASHRLSLVVAAACQVQKRRWG